jgi:predicted HTH transcriptional regulator
MEKNANKPQSLRDYLDSLMSKRETETIEFKHGKGGFPAKAFWESYSSFANTDGGVIVIGVKEKNEHFYPEGLSEDEIFKHEKAFWDGVNNPRQISCNLMTNSDVVKGEYEGNHIIMFFVPRAEREQRPVYVGENPMRGSYRRNASGDYLCKEREVAIMLSEQSPTLAEDFDIMEGFTLDDLHDESFRAYRQLFAALKPSHAWASDDDLALLKHLKAYRKDRRSGKEGITLAGLLMFGKIDAITDALPHYMIDYREYTHGGERWNDRIYNDGTWEANLFQAYRRILPKLQSFLPTPFQLQGNVRVEETKAHKALREAFVNLCVHASYQSDSKLTILKYPTEMIFSNPGTMLVSKDQYYAGGSSVCRNPALQTMFSLIGVAEKAGSGADTIIQGWKDSNYRMPIITEKSEPNKVELILPLESTLSEDVKHKLSILFGKNIQSLEPNKLKTLALAISMQCISNSILQHSLDLHRVDITDMLKSLCQDGYLLSSGIGRGTIYTINTNFQIEKIKDQFTPDVKTQQESYTSSSELGGLFDFTYDASQQEDGSNEIAHTIAIDDATFAQSSQLSDGERNDERNGERNDERNGERNDERNDERSHCKSQSINDMCNSVLAYCSSWKSAQEIARYTCISINVLRNKVIPKLSSEGLLELLHKETPRHRGQKYKSTAKGKKYVYRVVK